MNSAKRLPFLLRRLLSGLVFCGSAALFAKSPNIVLVITDDQGYGDLSCHGNPILKTPNLDALHRKSVRLTDYHVAPTCAPTRAALLSGHWTNRTGVWHTIMGRSMIRENEILLAQMLADAGYATGMFGKWHLGDNYPYRPEDRGFQEVLRHGGGGVGQTPDYWDNAYFDGSYWHNGKPTPVKGFCTDVFFDYAKRFIQSAKKSGKPFFAYISTNAPHGPMHAPPKSSKPYLDQNLNENLANFYGMIANIDDNVGALRKFLQEEELERETLFIFTTDNGTSSGAKVFNAGMRGQKGSEYDGGHRVPFFLHWPDGGLTDGRDVNMITSYVDITPTLLKLAGAKAPASVKFDGRDISPLIFDVPTEAWPDRILVTDSQRVRDPIKWRKSAVMTDRWRLINGKELYDIKADPSQKTNVAGQHKEVVQRLTDFYDAWWAELEPTFEQTTEIYLGHPEANPVRLTSHDWIADKATPWNQRHIRDGERRPGNTGFWAVKIVEPGTYQVELRRWPEEIDQPIQAAIPAGADVPGAKAFRTAPGKAFAAVKARLKLGGKELEIKIEPDDASVSFQLDLKPGTDELWASFETAEGEKMGAFFAYVRKL